MGFQAKSYRKFVAASATATLVATAVSPALAATNFSDVSGQYQEAVDYLVKEQITNGVTGTQFGTNVMIKRVDVAVMMAKALKLNVDQAPESGFEDVPARAVKYVNALKAAGVVNGKTATTFGSNQNVTRGELAIMLTNAYKLKGENTKVSFTDVSGRYVDAVAALVANKVTLGKNETTFGTNDSVKRGEFALFLYRINHQAVEAPAVESVQAINATTVQVAFKTAVDKADAEAGKVTIEGVTFTGSSLSKDGKVLTLTADAAIDVKNATVVVKPVKTKADALVKTEKFVSLLTYKDEVAPTISSVEAKTNGTKATEVTVKASEPVKTGALVKINGSYATVDFAGKDTAKITGLSLEAGKTHTIELINAEDLAGNKTISTTATFTVSVDATAPAATLTAQGDKEILVTFNKSMNEASVKAALANGSVKDEALAAVQTGAVKTVADSDNTQFIIPVSDALYTNKDSRTLNVVLTNAITDALGNKLEATTQKVTLTKDTVQPVPTGYNVVKDADGKVTAIEVNFSEGLAADANPGEPSIVNENGVVVTSTLLGGLQADAITAGDKKVTYKPAASAKVSGKFAFSFAANLVSDQAETANKSAAFNYTIDFGQGENVTTFEIADAPTSAANVITVKFPEAVKGGAVANSATDVANYTLGGKPLPADTTITLDADQKVATITLPADSIEKDDQAAIFTVANIKNTAGTKTVKSYTNTLAVQDNVKPVLQSAKVLDNQTIELTYSENVQLENSNTVGDSFKIVQGTDTLTLTDAELTGTVASGFENKLVVKVAKAATTLDLTKDITVETLAPATVDVVDKAAAKNTQKSGVKVTVVK